MDSVAIHVNDWIASETVALLGFAGEAIYLRALMHQWKNEGDGLPGDPELLRRLTGATPKEWRFAWTVMEKQFPVGDDGRRRNLRLENERQFFLARRERKSVAGRIGNAKRWHADAEHDPEAVAQPSQNDRIAIAEGSQKHRPSPTPTPSPTPKSSSTAVQQLGDSPVVLQPSRDGTAGILPIEALADRALARVRGGAA